MANSPRSLKINFCLNGIIVHVGCQTVVFNKKEDFLRELRNYLDEPIAMEQMWRENALFNDSEQPDCQPTSEGMLRPAIIDNIRDAEQKLKYQAANGIYGGLRRE